MELGSSESDSSDSANYLPIHTGTLLASRYEVQAFLGEGSYGVVVKCADILSNTNVAIKIHKTIPIFTKQAQEEIKILKQLQTLDPDRSNFVRWNGSFYHKRFICFEFELLDLSLSDFMEQRHHQPLSLREIRPILHQLTTALLHLETLGIIHADIKPDNIMVVDRRQQPLQVKLIDFGLAVHVSDAVPGMHVQSLWYRAPEVILGLVSKQPIDMWSVGVVAAELALGFPLFPGSHEYDVIKYIVDTLGQPPNDQLSSGEKSTHFFHAQGSFPQNTWRLKSPQEFARQTGHHHRDTRIFHLRSLDALKEETCFIIKAEKKELLDFVNLLKEMLLVDGNGRIIPFKVLEHPFFTVQQHADSSQSMNIKNLTTDRPISFEPVVPQQPSSLKKTAASKAMTPQEETAFTHSKLFLQSWRKSSTPPVWLVTCVEFDQTLINIWST